MNATLKKVVLILAITVTLLGFARINVMTARSDARQIDLFTQKIPYSGKGPNVPSDSFQPQELVILYANVTYNDCPVANKLVAFQVNNPANKFWNITIVGVNATDSNGIAQFSFRIPWSMENSEDIIFGEWFSVATVDVGGEVVMDTLIFKVGWIVEVTKLETLDKYLIPKTKFFREEAIIFNLTVKNIAFTPKLGTITIDAQDAANNPIIHVEIENAVFQPGVNCVNITSSIPKNSAVGEATVSAVAHTALPEKGGVPYCPPFYSTFEILAPPIKQYYLTVKTEPHNISMLHPIYGEGWYNEGSVVNLSAPKEILYVNIGVRYLFLYWDVDGHTQGSGVNTISVVMDNNHTATAHYVLQYYLTVKSPYGTSGGAGWYNAGSVAYATLNFGLLDHWNGTRRAFTCWSGDASGMLYNQSNPILMDGPKTAIALWKTQFYLSVRVDPIGITAVSGEGWYDAGANVTLSAPHVSDYNFSHWDVNGVSQGSGVSIITIFMDAPKTATAHYVKEAAPWAWFLPEWFYWLLLLLLLLLVLILLILYYRRRKRKETGEFHSGWTAWYYCYNLREARKIG
ncbi:MAG: hypothetical protein QXJ53_03515 [Candidatus Bathyarchaeia archaeon]